MYRGFMACNVEDTDLDQMCSGYTRLFLPSRPVRDNVNNKDCFRENSAHFFMPPPGAPPVKKER